MGESKQLYHFVIIPKDGGDDVTVSSNTLDDLLKKLPEALMKAKEGSVRIFISGELAELSLPEQSWKIRKQSGEEITVAGCGAFSYPGNGKFYVLHAP